MPQITYTGKRDGVDVVLPTRQLTIANGETVQVTDTEAAHLGTVPGFELKTPAKKRAATKEEK